MRTLEVELGPQLLGQRARPGGGESGAPLVFCQRRVDLALVMRLSGAGPGSEVGQRCQGDIDLDRTARDGYGFDLRPPLGSGVFTQ